ncbi:MAG: response regulator [Spirochaetales bacterium]|nr:response regulator [Spirochaetales bacterium]
MHDCDAVEILVIEDNPEDVELIIRALKKRHLANEVSVVEDGVQALDFIFCRGEYSGRNAAHRPKVIFLDLKLPKLNGIEVLKILKSDEHTKRIPVVVVSSSREDPDIKAAYELGANSYVVKPVDFESFLEAMDHTGYFWLLVNQVAK